MKFTLIEAGDSSGAMGSFMSDFGLSEMLEPGPKKHPSDTVSVTHSSY